jgi:hypothetical protein
VNRIFGLAAVSAIILAASFDGAQAQCPAIPGGPAFTVDVGRPMATYKSATADTLLTEAHANAASLGHGRGVLGLTVNRYDFGLRVTVDSVPTATGFCAWLRAVTIAVAANPEVLYDGRYAPDTCQRGAIIDHENEHVAVFRDAIAEAAPMIEAALHRAALPQSLVVRATADAEEAYARAIRAAVEPVLDAARARAQAANAQIDTPLHYAEVFRRCNAW